MWSHRCVHGSLFLNIPSIETLPHTIVCSFHLPQSPFPPTTTTTSLRSFPHCDAPRFLSSQPRNGFRDVGRRICCWRVLIAFSGREQGEGEKEGTGDMWCTESIILIKRASVMLRHGRRGLLRHFLCPLISQVSNVGSRASRRMEIPCCNPPPFQSSGSLMCFTGNSADQRIHFH